MGEFKFFNTFFLDNLLRDFSLCRFIFNFLLNIHEGFSESSSCKNLGQLFCQHQKTFSSEEPCRFSQDMVLCFVFFLI